MWRRWLGVLVMAAAAAVTKSSQTPASQKFTPEQAATHHPNDDLTGPDDSPFLTRPSHGSVLDSLMELNLQNETTPEDKDKTPLSLPNIAEDTELLKEVRPALGTILSHLQQQDSYDPPAPLDSTSTPAGNPSSPSPVMNRVDDLGIDVWGHLRSLVKGYLNLLEVEYETHGLKERLPLDLIRVVLQAGDQASLLNNKLSPELLGFLKEGIRPLFRSLTGTGRSPGELTTVLGEVGRRAARVTLHHFINHVLWATHYDVTKEDLIQYRDDLRRRAPLAAAGLDLLLDNGTSQGLARSYGAYGGGGAGGGYSYGEYGSPDGYGGYGGGSHGYGFYLDPYLVLASIGATALLALLGYRVLFAEDDPAPLRRRRRRRRHQQQLDDTDLPGPLHVLPATLEDVTIGYDADKSLGVTEEMDDLVEALNALWRERQHDPSCASCWVAHYAAHNAAPPRAPLAPLLVSLAAHMFGVPRPGQLMDEVTQQVLGGGSVTCPRLPHTCDLE